MSQAARISVVVPFEHATANLAAVIEQLAPERHPQVEFLLCRAAGESATGDGYRTANVRWLECSAGSRIPEMWRDGILAASGEFVALSTAHCIPSHDWVDRLLQIEIAADVAGIGGHFVNAPESSAVDWAIYLLRYSGFSQPVADAHATNIAADNAAYRRAAVLDCDHLLPRGFWELEYHREFAARGLRLCRVPGLVVVHRNRYRPRQFAAQRRDHGRQFGRDRARRLGRGQRLLYLLVMPAVAPLLFARVLSRARRNGLNAAFRITVSLWLLYFCLHWALGETAGVTDAILENAEP